MNGKAKIVVYILQGWIATASIAAVTVLGFRHDISGEAVIGVLGAVIGLAGGTTATTVHAMTTSGTSSGGVESGAPPTG